MLPHTRRRELITQKLSDMECVKDNSGWHSNCVHVEGILSDITGVLYDGGDGDGTPIPGSIEAVNKYVSQSALMISCHFRIDLVLQAFTIHQLFQNGNGNTPIYGTVLPRL